MTPPSLPRRSARLATWHSVYDGIPAPFGTIQPPIIEKNAHEPYGRFTEVIPENSPNVQFEARRGDVYTS